MFMNTFEEVIQSVILTYLNDNKHSIVADSANSIKAIHNQPLKIVSVILELPNSKEIRANFLLSEWAINANVIADSINSKIVLDFAVMVESLKTSFALVYKTVKWDE